MLAVHPSLGHHLIFLGEMFFKFVGRESVLALLKEKLDPTRGPGGQSSMVLYGMGGTRKDTSRP